MAQLDKMGFGWSKKSVRGGVGGAPGQLTPTRSETDFSEMDENAHLAIDSLNEDEVNAAFEKMLVRIVFFFRWNDNDGTISLSSLVEKERGNE